MHEIYLYGRDGCHLCDEARAILDQLLAERAAAGLAVPRVVERDIDTDPAWLRAFMTTIPVIELDGRRIELANSPRRIARLLADVLDPTTPAPAPTPGG